MKKQIQFYLYVPMLGLVSWFSSRGVDGHLKLLVFGFGTIGVSYFIHNLAAVHSVSRFHLLQLFIFPISSVLPAWYDSQLEEMGGILLIIIPAASIFIVLTTMLALVVRSWCVSCQNR